jgi:hypothetical protein
MTPFAKRYAELDQRLLDLCNSGIQGGDEMDTILEEQDRLWWEMEQSERVAFNDLYAKRGGRGIGAGKNP